MDTSIFSALVGQVVNNPASALVILPVSIVAIVLEMLSCVPNRLILPCCLTLGMLLFPGLVHRETVPPSFPNPLLVLILNGFILGFMAWAVHATLIRWLLSKIPTTQPQIKP